MWNNLSLAAIAAVALCAAPSAPAEAQSRSRARPRADTVTVYEREVFEYSRDGRPDPFRSLLQSADLGIRIEDLSLAGVVYHEDPARSVAILVQTGATRRIRARVGERVGAVRIAAIRPRSVDVIIEELGVARRETLELRPAAKKGGES